MGVPGGRARRTAARLTGAAVLALAIALALALASPASGSPRTAVAACVGSDLVASVTGQQAGSGNGVATIAVTNVGPIACRLGGYPQLRGVRAGHEYPLAIDGHTNEYGDLAPVDLAPRTSGALVIATTTGCIPGGDRHAAQHTYSATILVLARHRGTVTVPGELYVPCQLFESQLGWSRSFHYLTGNRPRGA